MMKLDWSDFNFGLRVDTKKGTGFIRVIDQVNKVVGVQIEGELQNFKIEEISLPLGSLKPDLTQQIGQFILLYQRIENRLRDFLNTILDLNEVQKKELVTSFTAGKLISQISSLVKRYGDLKAREIWKLIQSDLNRLNRVRNTVIHGYLFHYNDNFELDFKNLIIENVNGSTENLNLEKLLELSKEVIDLYYIVQNFFRQYDNKFREKIRTAGNKDV